jgi:HD-GYP domain-containing protein (c-di-GMP phosphodiesterase class II)
MHKGLSTRSAIVQAMMQALEARDYITEGHGERLESLVATFAQKIQLPAPVIADLRLLAKFHDIGKVGIPDNILFKPGNLTPDEVAVMRRHCDIGFRIAKSVPDLDPIADWILMHQEWWNGEGYPLNLAGEEIPLACRILALADAFDAMTNDRPYRKSMNYQAAIDEIRKCAGTQFDPVLAETFIEMLTKADETESK